MVYQENFESNSESLSADSTIFFNARPSVAFADSAASNAFAGADELGIVLNDDNESENSNPLHQEFLDEIARLDVSREAAVIQDALNYDSVLGHFGNIDSETIFEVLDELSEEERRALNQEYKRHNSSNLTLEEEFEWRLAPHAEAFHRAEALLARESDGRADDAGHLHAVLGIYESDEEKGAIALRQMIAILSSDEIQSLSAEYKSRYGADALAIMMNDEGFPESSQAALEIYLPGTDENYEITLENGEEVLRLKDTVVTRLLDIAIVRGDEMLAQEAFGNASSEFRQYFLTHVDPNGFSGRDKLELAFSGWDESIVMDYAEYGQTSLSLLVEGNTNWLNIDKDQISRLVRDLATPEERKLYGDGKQVAVTLRMQDADPRDRDDLINQFREEGRIGEDQVDSLEFYFRLNDSLKGAARNQNDAFIRGWYVYENEVAEWEDKLIYGGTIVSDVLDLERSHFLGIGGTYHNLDEVLEAISTMPEDDLLRMQSDQVYRTHVYESLQTILKGADWARTAQLLDEMILQGRSSIVRAGGQEQPETAATDESVPGVNYYQTLESVEESSKQALWDASEDFFGELDGAARSLRNSSLQAAERSYRSLADQVATRGFDAAQLEDALARLDTSLEGLDLSKEEFARAAVTAVFIAASIAMTPAVVAAGLAGSSLAAATAAAAGTGSMLDIGLTQAMTGEGMNNEDLALHATIGAVQGGSMVLLPAATEWLGNAVGLGRGMSARSMQQFNEAFYHQPIPKEAVEAIITRLAGKNLNPAVLSELEARLTGATIRDLFWASGAMVNNPALEKEIARYYASAMLSGRVSEEAFAGMLQRSVWTRNPYLVEPQMTPVVEALDAIANSAAEQLAKGFARNLAFDLGNMSVVDQMAIRGLYLATGESVAFTHGALTRLVEWDAEKSIGQNLYEATAQGIETAAGALPVAVGFTVGGELVVAATRSVRNSVRLYNASKENQTVVISGEDNLLPPGGVAEIGGDESFGVRGQDPDVVVIDEVGLSARAVPSQTDDIASMSGQRMITLKNGQKEKVTVSLSESPQNGMTRISLRDESGRLLGSLRGYVKDHAGVDAPLNAYGNNKPVFHLEVMMVPPRVAGQGVGKALTQLAVQLSERMGYEGRVVLIAEDINPVMPGAGVAHFKNGFRHQPDFTSGAGSLDESVRIAHELDANIAQRIAAGEQFTDGNFGPMYLPPDEIKKYLHSAGEVI